MKPIIDILDQRVTEIMTDLAGDSAPAVVRPTQDPKFGDYQANGVMGLAKKLKQNPRELAGQVIDKLDVSNMCEQPEIAGPGFINFRFRPDWLADRLTEAIKDESRLGLDPLADAPVTVVDYSSPNLAKEMHVGHLRSTIIGDVIARILEFWYGDENTPDRDPAKKVIRQNHVGDWGTQFGMLACYLYEKLHTDSPALDEKQITDEGELNLDIPDMEEFYRQAKQHFDADPEFAENSRDYVVKLQSGDLNVLALWRYITKNSLAHCQKTYETLNVKLIPDDVCGESFYNDRLPAVISALSAVNLLQESQGAQCVFLDGFKTKEGEPLPLIVRKSDGAFLYATTDLAAVRYRIDELKARRIIYVTDARQKLHFEMFFACARRAGWANEQIALEHVPFGSVLGPDNRPFKTRSGENVKLRDLLDEAVARARKIVDEKNPDLDERLKQQIARAVGIGAVKYADLSNNLASDYVFNWDKMLAMEGNTAPYMQYAYARTQSIFRKGSVNLDDLLAADHAVTLTQPEEMALAKLLLRYGEIVETVARDLRPHLLTTYLFDLAQAFSGFYTNCPVLKAEDAATSSSRLLLCCQTARTIRHGLGLLGIETIEQM